MSAHRSRKNREWSDELMFELMEKINQGYSYQDVTDGTHIPILTLWTRVKGYFHGQIRPKTGAPTLFSKELEGDFALYVKHCSLLRVPRWRKLLKEDIMHYVTYKELKIEKLAEDGPGRSWQDRFANEWSDLVKFHTSTEIFQIQNDPISMKEWINERDNYTRIQIFTKYFPSRRYIFFIEAQKLAISALNRQEFNLAISYNAEGEMLIPFVIHKGHLPEALTSYFKGHITFFQTDDGNFDRNSVCLLVLQINLFMEQNGLNESPVIYLCPELAKHFSFFVWDHCNTHNIIIQTVPCNIYRYFHTCNMGVFEKLKPKFMDRAKTQFPDKSKVCLRFNFLQILRTVVEESQWSAHLRNSCRRLRIVHVSLEIAQDADEEVPDD